VIISEIGGRFFVFEKEFTKEGLAGREEGISFSRGDAEAQRTRGCDHIKLFNLLILHTSA